MSPVFNRISMATGIALAVVVALVVIQAPMVTYDLMIQRHEIVAMAARRAGAALDMLEAVHVQSMLNRRGVGDGDPAVATLNGSMEQFSVVSRGVALWLVMAPKVIAYQRGRGARELEGPKDAVDEAAIRQGLPQQDLNDGILRISRPVILGRSHAADLRCAACHTALMRIANNEVIGGYSARVDLRPDLAEWRVGMARRAGTALAIVLLTVSFIVLLLRATALRPLRGLAAATRRLAQGDVDVPIDYGNRPDEVGAMARALEIFRGNLIARQRLERASDAAQSEARYLASHDPLTDLPNRVLLADRLKQAIMVARRQGSMAAVLCLDLDHFKEVNDTLGHAAGDELLCEAAVRLRSCLRETDTAARFGGDEFAIVQTGLEYPSEVEALCHRLLALFSEPFRVGGHEVFVGLSIGAALMPDDGDDAETLLKHADIALYRAKAEGRNTYRFFLPEMNIALKARKALEQDLRAALVRDEFQLHYQPSLDVASGVIVGVEALLRWHHPERGLVGPAEFIPVAEATGLILPIGKWVLRTACTQAARWPDLMMAVNLSPVQFHHPDLVGLVRGILEESGLSAHRLELEITEGVLLEDADAALPTLMALKKLGVRIAMDDFGTGYSSLSYLQRFPFDKLKIDQSFVRTLELDGNAAAIVRSVVGLGRSLGMDTTAEGVETASQLHFLQREGCDQAQGYHLGRPMPAQEIDRLLMGSTDSHVLPHGSPSVRKEAKVQS